MLTKICIEPGIFNFNPLSVPDRIVGRGEPTRTLIAQ